MHISRQLQHFLAGPGGKCFFDPLIGGTVPLRGDPLQQFSLPDSVPPLPWFRTGGERRFQGENSPQCLRRYIKE